MKKIFYLVPILVGIFFVVAGLFFYTHYDPSIYDQQTLGTVVDILEEYDAIDERWDYTALIDYEAEGIRFHSVPYDHYDSSMKVGDKVEVNYVSGDPASFAGAGKDKAPYIGLAFVALGILDLAITLIKMVKGPMNSDI